VQYSAKKDRNISIKCKNSSTYKQGVGGEQGLDLYYRNREKKPGFESLTQTVTDKTDLPGRKTLQ